MRPGEDLTEGAWRSLKMGARSVLAASCLFVSVPCARADDGKPLDIQAVLAGKIDPATFNTEQRSQCEAELRTLAASEDSGTRRRANTVLLNLGDTQTVHAVLQAIDSRHAYVRDDAERVSLACHNPDVMPSFVNLLFLNEDPGMIVLNSEFLRSPRSVTATKIIRQIITASPQFPSNTRDWARSLDDDNSGAFREAIRGWWRTNAVLIQAHEYEGVAPPGVATNSAPSVDALVAKLLASTNQVQDFAALTDAQRASAMESLRATASQGTYRVNMSARLLLIDVGDKESIQTAMQMFSGKFYRDYKQYRDILWRSSQPLLIPLLAVDMMAGGHANFQRVDNEAFDFPRSVYASELIRSLLVRSPAFREPVRKWAAGLAGFQSAGTPDKLRTSMRRWWAENRQFIEKGEYAKVAPPSDEKESAGVGPQSRQ